MKLVLDQGLPRSACAILRDLGHEAIHVGDVGMAQAADIEILALPESTGATVVTLDADFHALLVREASTKASVVRLRIQGMKGERLAALVHAVVESCKDSVDAGAAVSADEQTARVRRLPIT